MTSTTEPKETATKTAKMSRESTMWDEAEKGFLTDAERIAKNMDVEGKGHLSKEQSVSLCITGGNKNDTLQDLIRKMKEDAQLWHDLLWCSGGKLELPKCGYHVIHFNTKTAESRE